MPKLSEFKGLTVPVKVDIGGVALHIQFYAGKMTGKLRRDMEEKAKAAADKLARGEEANEEETEIVAQMLVKLLADWDLTDEKEKPCPITVRFLVDELGYYGMNKILLACMGATNPNA